MRLVHYGNVGKERAGLLDNDGHVRSLSPLVGSWTVDHLSDEWQAALSAIDISKLPIVPGTPRLGIPITGVTQLLAIGLNYRDHAAEAQMEVPSNPMLFQKALGSISGPFDDILLAPGAVALDWEVELAAIIRKRGRHISVEDALDYVGGYLLANDVSERDWQFNEGGLHNKGKSYDSFTPLGPWLVTPAAIPDPQVLRIWLMVNGEPRQDGNTDGMVFSVAECISHVSRFQTLLPGDVLLTGTPAGVGFGMIPRKYMGAGDVMTCGVDHLGEQTHRVVAEA